MHCSSPPPLGNSRNPTGRRWLSTLPGGALPVNPSAAPGKTSPSVRRRGRQRAVGRDLSAEGAGGLVRGVRLRFKSYLLEAMEGGKLEKAGKKSGKGNEWVPGS